MENEILQQILSKLTSMDNRLDKMETDIKDLKQGQQQLLEDSPLIKRAVLETNNDVKIIKQDLKELDIVTAQNCKDITRLRATK